MLIIKSRISAVVRFSPALTRVAHQEIPQRWIDQLGVGQVGGMPRFVDEDEALAVGQAGGDRFSALRADGDIVAAVKDDARMRDFVKPDVISSLEIRAFTGCSKCSEPSRRHFSIHTGDAS